MTPPPVEKGVSYMNYYNNDYDRGYTEATMSAADYMARTYRWMACGLVVTFAVALLTVATPLFYLVNYLAPSIVSRPGISFSILVGTYRPQSGKHLVTYIVLGCDELNPCCLSFFLFLDQIENLEIMFHTVSFNVMPPKSASFISMTTNTETKVVNFLFLLPLC